MAAPTREHEFAPPGRRFTRRIVAEWDQGHGPEHHGQDFLPIGGYLLIRNRVEELMATRSRFGMTFSHDLARYEYLHLHH